jgi:hypothetical protein
MSLAFFGRRVPIYISLLVISVCGAAGFATSTVWPVKTAPKIHHTAANHYAPAATMTLEGSTPTGDSSLPTQADETTSVALAPNDDKVVPAELASAPAVNEPQTQVVDDVPKLAPRASNVVSPLPKRARASHVRFVSNTRRPQHTTQSRSSASAKTSSAGLKSIPIIGPVFSLLQ